MVFFERSSARMTPHIRPHDPPTREQDAKDAQEIRLCTQTLVMMVHVHAQEIIIMQKGLDISRKYAKMDSWNGLLVSAKDYAEALRAHQPVLGDEE
eukprot:scaffold29334_cov73-Skeletonema_dohrnii-CCMP3373.AAC.2